MIDASRPVSLLRQAGNSVEGRIISQYAMTTDTPMQVVRIEDLGRHRKALRTGLALPVGSVEFVRAAMALAQIPEPANLSYPEALRAFLSRTVTLLPAGAVSGRCFIKPTETKAFTGFVCDTQTAPDALDAHDRQQFLAFSDLAPDTPVWVSEPVTWVSELRYYLVNGEIRGAGRYDDGPDDAPEPDPAVVDAMVRCLAAQPAPAAFALDVGVLDTGATALVECNDAWALGFYRGTLSARDYVQMLWVRWGQLAAAPNGSMAASDDADDQ